MKSKPVQWLMAAALILAIAVPGWAQPDLVGGEFRVNQNNQPRQLKPQVAFSPSGSSLIVWENDLLGILARAFDRNGKPTTPEKVVVGNTNLPNMPGRGNVTVRKDPALIFLPGGEYFVFWTEQKEYLVVDYFFLQRSILEQDVYGQRFSAEGVAVGARFLLSSPAADFQRRPKAALTQNGIAVVWEQAAKTSEKDSTALYGRLLTRRGAPAGAQFRIDAGDSPEIWTPTLAANASGELLVAWEAGAVDTPDVLARLYDRDGDALGDAFVANPSTPGRQRRPAALATRDGDFLLVWQSTLSGTPIRSTVGQLYSPAGARIGGEIEMSTAAEGHLHIAPALALLPSGNVVVTWIDWTGTWPTGLYARVLDRNGTPLGDKVLISQDRMYPQYQTSVATNAQGDILAAWESRITRARAIAARRLKAD